jgi:hypothetical protein
MIEVVEACNENVSNKGGEDIIESKPEGRKNGKKAQCFMRSEWEHMGTEKSGHL